MIAQLRGTLVLKESNLAVIDVHGVGYAVSIPITSYTSLPALGEEALLYTHTHVREDALALFGFLDPRDRALFERLITVGGVGPKLALTVLSGLAGPDLVAAIRSGDVQKLVRIPGVGRKTGERIILELREKLGPAEGESAPAGPAAAVDREVVSALVNLGCGRDPAERAVEKARQAGAPAEFDALFRRALELIGR